VAALGAILIPVYVKLMGVESYALVGIAGTLYSIFGMLDLGLGAGLNREIARLTAAGASDQERRDLLATFDVLGGGVAVLASLAVYFMAPFIAYRWVNAQELDRGAIVDAIRMIGVWIGLQLPIGFYQGGVNGLERQVLSNALWISLHTVRGIGSVLVLTLIAPTVRVFFGWQLVVWVVGVIMWATVLHLLVDRGQGRGTPRRDLFNRVWRYSAGWIGNSAGVVGLGMTDKVVLSRVLTLRDFGYYTFASYGAQLLLNLVTSVVEAAFPRVNRLLARNDQEGLRAEYRRGNQTIVTLLMPVAFVIIFFNREALLIWTRDAELTAATSTLLAILATGMIGLGLGQIAYFTALAHGMFRMTMKLTAVLAVIFVPLMILVPRWYGVIGAAVVWAAMSACRAISVPLLHRHHLKGEGMIWLRQAVIVPVLVTGVIGAVARVLAPHFTNTLMTLAYLAATWLLMVIALIAVEPAMRATVMSAFRTLAARTSA